MQEIVYRLNFFIPKFDLYASLSLSLALAASLIFLFFLFFRTSSIFRLSIFTAALLHVFFQWPLFIISNVLETSLENPYWPAFAG